jgi:proteasome alpha subunit
VSMPFYVSPAQQMRDKAEYARQGIARGRSCVTLQYAGGILMMAPNPSSALHKISEIYDRIAFAAVGRYNEYENLRKAGVTVADITGYQFDRHDVTARGIANYYAQTLGTIFTESNKPFEVEIVVAEVGEHPDGDQIYRITFDGSVTDEPGFVAFGGEADRVSAVLKERYSEGLSLAGAFGAALAALSASGNSASGNGERTEIVGSQLEVAILDRTRDHRTFRRIRAARLEELIAEARAAESRPAKAAAETGAETGAAETGAAETGPAESGPAEDESGAAANASEAPKASDTPAASQAPDRPKAPETPSDSVPPTGPDPSQTDRGSGTNGGDRESPL